MKSTKRTLEHIELVQSDLAPMFEVKLLVVMEGYVSADEGDLTASEWLHNLLQMAVDGKDISHGAREFLRSMISTGETQVHLCKIEKVEA